MSQINRWSKTHFNRCIVSFCLISNPAARGSRPKSCHTLLRHVLLLSNCSLIVTQSQSALVVWPSINTRLILQCRDLDCVQHERKLFRCSLKKAIQRASFKSVGSRRSHQSCVSLCLPSNNRWQRHYRVAQKWYIFLVRLNFIKYWPIFKMCNNTITKDPTTPQVCRYTTLWNVSCLQSNNWKKTTSVTTHFKKLTRNNVFIASVIV